MSLVEQPLYGTDRLGVRRPNLVLPAPGTAVAPLLTATRTLGQKSYELTDPLGNVRVVVGDQTQRDAQGAVVPALADYYAYYAFGMLQPGSYGRGNTAAQGGYRYGHNGQEHDGTLGLSHYTAQYWEYDARLARRWNLDPVPLTEESQYAAFRNNPVRYNDPNGDCPPGRPCPPNPLHGRGNAASQPDLLTALRGPLNKMVAGVVNAVLGGLAAADRFTNSTKGTGSEQRLGLVFESKAPNGTDAGGNTAKRVHKTDGDTFKEMKDVIDGPALLGGKEFTGNRGGGSVADVTSATNDAVEAIKENKETSSKRKPAVTLSRKAGWVTPSTYVINNNGVIRTVKSNKPLVREREKKSN